MLVQLQYMRAVAALLVVYFHSVLQLQNLNLEHVPAIPAIGECGVDLFFVLSGFVMWITTADRNMTPFDFYQRRVKRIVPLYWTVTIAAAMVALFAPQLLKSTKFAADHFVASLFFVPWTNPAMPAGNVITPVVIPGWTLNYEMYFYLIFGALLLVRQSLRAGALLAILALVFVACQLAPDTFVAAQFYREPVVFEFAAGVLVGQLYLAGFRFPEPFAWFLIAAALAVLLVNDAMDLTVTRLWIYGLPATVILAGIVSINFVIKKPVIWLKYLGDASYSIYLTHIFVLTGTRIVFAHIPVSALQNPYVFLVGAILGSVIVGSLVHSFYEGRINDWLSRKPVMNANAKG